MFHLQADGELHPRWVLDGIYWRQQLAFLQAGYAGAVAVLEKGCWWVCVSNQQSSTLISPSTVAQSTQVFRREKVPYVVAAQTGWLRHGLRRREVQEWFVHAV